MKRTNDGPMVDGTSLSGDFASGVLREQAAPCVSIFQPTHRHHPDNRQNPIRFANLVVSAEKILLDGHPTDEVEALLRPLRNLESNDEFWAHAGAGLAVLGAPGFFRAYVLSRRMPERVVVADSFHTKPLLRILQSADRFQILGLTRDRVRMFEGNRDGLEEIGLHDGVPASLVDALGDEHTEAQGGVHGHRSAGGSTAIHHGQGARKEEFDVDTERFFRAVDRTVFEHHTRATGLPLLLAALPEHQSMFRRVSRNPRLMPDRLLVNPGVVTLDELRERAWDLLLPGYARRLSTFVEQFGSARAKGRGASDLAEVARAAVEGRVRTLMVDADRERRGALDRVTGAISPVGPAGAEVDDLLDDLAELVLEKGGEVIVVPADRMPDTTGLAAIFSH